MLIHLTRQLRSFSRSFIGRHRTITRTVSLLAIAQTFFSIKKKEKNKEKKTKQEEIVWV